MTKQEITALIMMLEHQNRLLADYAAKIQGIKTFLQKQTNDALWPHSAEGDPSGAEVETDLRESLRKLEKALSGRP
jgi:hypothetical protein